jgi:hypothetical protein
MFKLYENTVKNKKEKFVEKIGDFSNPATNFLDENIFNENLPILY